jgi:hypothetical protein
MAIAKKFNVRRLLAQKDKAYRSPTIEIGYAGPARVITGSPLEAYGF